MDARSYAASKTLKDGAVRALRSGDAGAILQAFRVLDRESVYRRFCSPKKDLSPDELGQLTDVNFEQVVALVHNHAPESGEVLIGCGRYAVERDRSMAKCLPRTSRCWQSSAGAACQ
jgi:hypothetical protein